MSKGKNIFNQWRDLLFGTKSHELLVFCFFLAVSFGFWLLQALNETLEREVQVRLELENIPDNVVIHRLTGDGDKKILVAPLWSGNKKRVLNRIKREVLNL